MEEKNENEKREFREYFPYVFYGYIAGLEQGVVTSLVRYIKELRDRGLIPEEKAGKAIEAVLQNYGFGRLTYGEVAEKVEEFYRSTPNMNFPLLYIVPLICKRENGIINEEQMGEELQKLRLQFQET
jgi:hypothetical protein